MEKEIAVFIPIIFFLVSGVIIITAIFFKSREKQLLIERGMSTEDIKMFYQEKRDPYRLMKIGVVIFFFGLGLGIGLILQAETDRNYWVPFLMFTLTGIGFIAANLIARNLERKTV
jgi:intracellular septation protein A